MIFSKCSTKLCPDDNIVPGLQSHRQTDLPFPVFFNFSWRGTIAKQWLSWWEREGLNWRGRLPTRGWNHLHLAREPPRSFSRSAAHCFASTWSFSDAATDVRERTAQAGVGRYLSGRHFDVRHEAKLLIQIQFFFFFLVNAIYWGICQWMHNSQWEAPGCVIGHYWHRTDADGSKTDECWWSF